MKSNLLRVVCAGGLTLSVHAAAADPARQPSPEPVPPASDTAGPVQPPVPGSVDPMTSPSPDATTPPPIVSPATTPPPLDTSTTTPAPMTSVPPAGEYEPSVVGWRESGPASRIGIGVTVGGGVSGFTSRAMRDTVSSDVSGLWDFRLSVGTHVPIGVDLTYVGSAGNVRTLTGEDNGTLIGTTAEAAVRWNVAPHANFNPYLFAGVGWQRYDVRNMAFATSDTGLSDHDSFMEVPVGLGLSFRNPSGFTADLRGTFRAAVTDATLVTDLNGNDATLNTWEASGALGWEF